MRYLMVFFKYNQQPSRGRYPIPGPKIQPCKEGESTDMSVKRIYVEKKPDFAVKARELAGEIGSYLGIKTVTGVRVLIRYDIENLSGKTYDAALGTIFSEPPVDFLYEEDFPREKSDLVFSVEYLPGQFDQRADSAEQCVKLLREDEEPVIRTATTYVISGSLTDEEAHSIKSFCINPVDSREAGSEKPDRKSTRLNSSHIH